VKSNIWLCSKQLKKQFEWDNFFTNWNFETMINRYWSYHRFLYHKRTKHIEMRWHWIRKMMNRKKIILRYLFISEMIADDLIKSLSVLAFSKFRIMLNLSSWLIERKKLIRWSSYWWEIIIMIKWKCWTEKCWIIIAKSFIESLESESKSVLNRTRQRQSRSLSIDDSLNRFLFFFIYLIIS
jgi:hypothetical protein